VQRHPEDKPWCRVKQNQNQPPTKLNFSTSLTCGCIWCLGAGSRQDTWAWPLASPANFLSARVMVFREQPRLYAILSCYNCDRVYPPLLLHSQSLTGWLPFPVSTSVYPGLSVEPFSCPLWTGSCFFQLIFPVCQDSFEVQSWSPITGHSFLLGIRSPTNLMFLFYYLKW